MARESISDDGTHCAANCCKTAAVENMAKAEAINISYFEVCFLPVFCGVCGGLGRAYGLQHHSVCGAVREAIARPNR